MAAAHVQHMQKALTQMNLQIHPVLSDITGRSGLAILDAIVAGEHNPAVLAQLRQPQVQASAEVVMKSLVGDYRREASVHPESIPGGLSLLPRLDHPLRPRDRGTIAKLRPPAPTRRTRFTAGGLSTLKAQKRVSL